MDYQYLTREDKLQVLEEVRSSQPTPEDIIKEAERNHWKSTVQAALGINPIPAYIIPDIATAQIIHNALNAIEVDI